jgi:hypothetical protein
MSRHVEALLTDEEAGLLDVLKQAWKRDEQTAIRAAIAVCAAQISMQIINGERPPLEPPQPQ